MVLAAPPPPLWAPKSVAPTPTPTNPNSIPVPVTPVSSPVGVGVPVGPFHLPNDQYGVRSWYNGTLRALSPIGAATDLAYAKSMGIRIAVSLPGSRAGYTNSDKTFSMSRWKRNMDAWRSQAAMLQSYYAIGTIIANYLVDEPDCSSCWGGKPISGAEVAEMADTRSPSSLGFRPLSGLFLRGSGASDSRETTSMSPGLSMAVPCTYPASACRRSNSAIKASPKPRRSAWVSSSA